MVFDRISLISIYDALKIVQDNDGPVSDILLNRAGYSNKTIPRIATLADLIVFIEDKYPYQIFNAECDCVTFNESIYRILAFKVHVPGKKHAVFVNNIRAGFESQKEIQLNSISVKKIHKLFQVNKPLELLKANYVCFPYIEQPGNYISPCDYTEVITNKAYDTLINIEYRKTKRLDFPKSQLK